ncbi:MAG: cytochrome c [Pleurocapsa sp. SU_196_0]|nr:cytochrome c [Pleurocapsa sp. SU_196_0]
MNAAINSILGTLFLLLAFGTVFLMYHLWGYPFDKVKRKSAAPPSLMRLHRIMGVAYLLIYVVLMTQMVPRLLSYQVEFPARTVAHIVMGMLIGAILLVKLSILRWFRHLEEWMPALGTSLLFCTIILSALSIPFAVRAQNIDGSAFRAETLERLRRVLPDAGFPVGTNLESLSTVATLRAGQQDMLSGCTGCHDLRTVLIRPRTPSEWVQTITRMADKPNPQGELSPERQHRIAAYLVAITPELQLSAQKKREALVATQTSSVTDAKRLFETACAGCHELTLTDAHDFKTDPPPALVKRMVTNGLKLGDSELEAITKFIEQTYVK